MSIWLFRIGRHGQHEAKFLEDARIYLTWRRMGRDLGTYETKQALTALHNEVYPDWSTRRTGQSVGEFRRFLHDMQIGDLVLVPLKSARAVAVGEITGEYEYEAGAEEPYWHSRTVRWIATDVPRTNFDGDIRGSLNTQGTVREIRAKNAEQRVWAMSKGGWSGTPIGHQVRPSADDADDSVAIDLEQQANDMIADVLQQRFFAHGLETVVEAILKAQGYTVWSHGPGADKGVDLLAAPGALGFGNPRLCVQVKSGKSPVGREELDKLVGSMQRVSAEHGLFVSWSGFKDTVRREEPAKFFSIRLWEQKDLIEALLENYERLSDDMRAEIPLKRVWVVVPDEDEG